MTHSWTLNPLMVCPTNWRTFRNHSHVNVFVYMHISWKGIPCKIASLQCFYLTNLCHKKIAKHYSLNSLIDLEDGDYYHFNMKYLQNSTFWVRTLYWKNTWHWFLRVPEIHDRTRTSSKWPLLWNLDKCLYKYGPIGPLPYRASMSIQQFSFADFLIKHECQTPIFVIAKARSTGFRIFPLGHFLVCHTWACKICCA